MCLVKVHKPISMNKHHLQSQMNCILIGKTPGPVISTLQRPSKGFSDPDILNFLNYFCPNLAKFDYGGFLSMGLAIFWYNLSENVVGVLKEKIFLVLPFSRTLESTLSVTQGMGMVGPYSNLFCQNIFAHLCPNIFAFSV